MSLFFVDSASDLDVDQIKKLGIESISFNYTINDKKFEFNNEFDFDKFYSKFKKGVCVNIEHLSEDRYIDIFEPCLSQGDDIIYVHSSGNLLDLANLHSAKETLNEFFPDRKFEIVDSANISIGQGALSIDLAMMYRRGDSLDEIE